MRLLARLCVYFRYIRAHTLPVKLSENDNLFRVKDLPPKEKREQNNHPLVSELRSPRGLKSILSAMSLNVYLLRVLDSLLNHLEEMLAEFTTWCDWIIGKENAS